MELIGSIALMLNTYRKVYIGVCSLYCMNINKRIQDRIKWCNDLYLEVLERSSDEEVAKTIFKTIMFEENLKGG